MPPVERRSGIFRRSVLTGGTDELLFASERTRHPLDISPDGGLLLYEEGDAADGWDLLALPLPVPPPGAPGTPGGEPAPEPEPIAVSRSPVNDRRGQFSPDGRWVLYESDESQQSEIYLQPFPGPGQRIRVSAAGGAQPRWRRDGRELHFVALDRHLMAAAVRLAPGGAVGGRGRSRAVVPYRPRRLSRHHGEVRLRRVAGREPVPDAHRAGGDDADRRDSQLAKAPMTLHVRRLVALLLLAGATLTCGRTADERFAFALVGDNPYSAEAYPKFERLIAAVNRQPDIGWVVHVGDVKAGTDSCSDEELTARFRLNQRFEPPLMFTPGDNDWQDCDRQSAGGFDPWERLGFLRRLFYPDPTRPVDSAMLLDSQSSRPKFADVVENAMWQRAGIVFATVHATALTVPPAAPERPQHLADAAAAWIREAFQRAQTSNARALFLAMQGDPWVVWGHPRLRAPGRARGGRHPRVPGRQAALRPGRAARRAVHARGDVWQSERALGARRGRPTAAVGVLVSSATRSLSRLL